jgi:pyruvate dehydrogenase E2 component (dihydrolipoamide acetyltransferase)
VEAAVVGEPATGVRKAGAVENVASYVPLTGVRGIIAERMAASAHTTARVTLVSEVDATELVAARERLKETVAEEWGFVPGYNDLLGLIVSRALRESPYMNARLGANGQTIEQLPDVNVGMAVDTERGLLVPVVRYADRLGLRAFGEHLRELVDRARQGRSLPEDLSGGTFTITNLGMYEIDAFTPIINLPEAAILGVGRIRPQAVPQAGRIVVRQMMTLSLSFDHRLVDGAPAARFLQQIKELVEAPHAFLA